MLLYSPSFSKYRRVFGFKAKKAYFYYQNFHWNDWAALKTKWILGWLGSEVPYWCVVYRCSIGILIPFHFYTFLKYKVISFLLIHSFSL